MYFDLRIFQLNARVLQKHHLKPFKQILQFREKNIRK